jgi:hypothetical protein
MVGLHAGSAEEANHALDQIPGSQVYAMVSEGVLGIVRPSFKWLKALDEQLTGLNV